MYALVYAAELHDRQMRKGTRIPYVAHLMSVASLVLEDGGDEDEVIAGLLHDAVEDQGGRLTLDVIRSRFGRRLANIVEECSDAETIPKPPWRERKERYIEHLKVADRGVLRVALADKLHNARAVLADYRTFGEGLWSRSMPVATRPSGTTVGFSRYVESTWQVRWSMNSTALLENSRG
jgi:(p)ppGpp synthase/HD superfamily hydrolase